MVAAEVVVVEDSTSPYVNTATHEGKYKASAVHPTKVGTDYAPQYREQLAVVMAMAGESAAKAGQRHCRCHLADQKD